MAMVAGRFGGGAAKGQVRVYVEEGDGMAECGDIARLMRWQHVSESDWLSMLVVDQDM